MANESTPQNVEQGWAGARGDRWRRQLSAMEGMLRPVNEPLIGALDLGSTLRIAEVGCGGGATALEISSRAPKGSVVHGFDISPTLVEVAKGRIPPNQRDVAFHLVDMGKGSPPDGQYDRLASRFGVMFFDEPLGAFANLARWLVPGGRFAFAVWGPPVENPWMTTVRDAVAEVTHVPDADPDAPGPFRYADPRKLLTLLQQAGFTSLATHEWRGSIPVGGGLTANAAATFALGAFAIFAELLASAGDEASAIAHKALSARFSAHERDGIVSMDACVHIVTGGRG